MLTFEEMILRLGVAIFLGDIDNKQVSATIYNVK